MLCGALLLFSGAVSGVSAVGTNEPAESFRSRCAALAREAAGSGTMTLSGRDGWLFLASELRHLGAGKFWGESAAAAGRALKKEHADPLPAILDFHAQLSAMGIELLLVPVPPKAVVYPDFLPGDDSCGSAEHPGGDLQAFYGILREKGVRVLDLTGVFQKNRLDPQGPLYCRQDSHWSGVACVLAATEIAGESAMARSGDSHGNSFTGSWENAEISGDLWQALPEPRPPREKLCLRRVSRPGESDLVEPDTGSPVILLGDSHCLVFHGGDDMLSRGCGLPDQLALELGMPVDLVAVRGSGATPARINLLRRAQRDPGYWKGKKLVIWCFSAREFTESDGWRKVPLKP